MSVLWSDISVCYGRVTFKLCKLTNLKAGALFPAVLMGIRLIVFIKKNRGRGYSGPLEDR